MLTQSKVVKGIKEHGYKYPFDNVKIYFSSSDISIANLEFPISKRGIPVNKKWTFRANPSILKSLAYSGINVFGIANNHACDYGTNAFLDTIDYLKKSSFSVVGGGTVEALVDLVLGQGRRVTPAQRRGLEVDETLFRARCRVVEIDLESIG